MNFKNFATQIEKALSQKTGKDSDSGATHRLSLQKYDSVPHLLSITFAFKNLL